MVRTFALVMVVMISLVCVVSPALAGDRRGRRIVAPRVYAPRVYVPHGGRMVTLSTQGAFTTLGDQRRWRPNPCFPFRCGDGIGPTLRNPDPENARKPENLTACIYDAQNTLVYEREGKVCPYKYVDANAKRVERRRLEYLESLKTQQTEED